MKLSNRLKWGIAFLSAALLAGIGWQVWRGGAGVAAPTSATKTHSALIPDVPARAVRVGSLAVAAKDLDVHGGSEAASQSVIVTSASDKAAARKGASARTATLDPAGCPANCPKPEKGLLIGSVVDYRKVLLPPTEKGGPWGERHEWLTDRGEGYPNHLEEDYRLNEKGEMVLVASRQYAAHQVIVKIDGETSIDDFRDSMAAAGATVNKPLFKFEKGARLVTVRSNEPATLNTVSDLEEAVVAYRRDLKPSVDLVKTVNRVPDDSYYASQWALPKVSAPQAWDLKNDASSVVVAVLDSGIRYTHVDLAGNMWHNPNPGQVINELFEITSFTGDTYGISCIEDTISSDPMDDVGHGTHCAGIIGAVGNNGKGVCGMAWKAKLMACKWMFPYGGTGVGYSSDEYMCIYYAAMSGAKVFSCSFGSSSSDSTESDLIAWLRSMGIVVVCAAGNDGVNTDTIPNYPSSYTHDNIVSVAATDSDDTLCTRAKNGWSGGSNYGVTSVDIAAPGDDIRSTYNSNNTSYEYLSGTSMACPFAAGAVALIMSKYSSETYLQIIQRLYNGGDGVSALSGKVKTGKRLNLYTPLSSAKLASPTGVTATRGTYADRVVVSWSSVSGASHYRVYRAQSSTGTKTALGSWQSATSYSDSNVTPGDTYYYWVTAAASSSGSKESSYSSVASGYAQPAVRDSWDPGDDTASGGTSLTPTTSEQTHGTHTLSANDKYDFFKIAMTSGRTYTFESSGTGDTYGELYSSTSTNASNRVAYNDDGAGSGQFKITYTPTVSQTFYLRVRCFTLGATAQYSLKYSATAEAVDRWDPGDDTFAGGTSITPTTTLQSHGPHRLVSGSDTRDYFKISLTAGRTYLFQSVQLTGDVVGELYDSARSLVTQNDDGGGNSNFKIEYTPTASGTYYLSVRAFAFGTATYTLQYKYTDAASYDIIFYPITSYKNWPSDQGALISLSTNDLSSPVTQFKTTDTVYLYHGWAEKSAQRFPESMYNFITITRQNSTNVLSWCQYHWVGGINSGYTGTAPWALKGLSAGSYTATFKLNENKDGQRIIAESNYANNIQKINFTVVEPGKQLSSISISGNASVSTKGTAKYACVATYTDRTSSAVTPTWTVTSGGAYATIAADGTLTAGTVTSEQRVTISAAYGGKTATKQITIVPEKTIDPPFDDVVVYPTAPMVIEAQASINDAPAEEGDVVAAFSGDEVRGVGSVVAGGRVTMAVYVASANETITFKAFDASAGDEGTIYPGLQSLQCNPGETKGTAQSPIALTFSDNDPFGEVQVEPTVPTVIEAQVTIDDLAAASGDILGVFSGDTLVGKQIISYGSQGTGGNESGDPIAYCSLVLFVSGSHTLTFQVWDSSEQELFDCANSLSITGGDIVGTTSSRYQIKAVSFNEDNTPCDVSLPSRGWNLVSFSVIPESATPSSVFDPVKGSIRYVSSGTSLWSPTSGGNLTQIRIGSGYWVNRSSSDAVNWTVEGTGDPDTELRLSDGWNLVGYTLPRAGYVRNVLATALAAGRISYVVHGSSLYPNGGLSTMGPGLGYWVRATGACTIKFDREGMMSGSAAAAAMKALSEVAYGPFVGEVAVDPGVPTILTDVSFSVYGKRLAVGDCVALYSDDGKLYAVARMEDETSKMTLPLFANGGKRMHFRIWNSASGTEHPEIFEADAACDFVSPTQGDEIVGKEVTVTGVAPSYTVVYDLGGKGIREGGGALTQSVSFGGASEDPVVNGMAGWSFRGWSHSKRSDIRSDVTYTALYDEVAVPDVTVSFDANGGTGAGQPVTAVFGSPMPQAGSAPTRTGMDFLGYYDDREGGTQYYSADMSSSRNWDKGVATTLYAHWAAHEYTISFNANGGVGVMDAVVSTYGVVTNLPACTFTLAGMRFDGWALTVDGDVAYADGAEVSNLTADNGVTVVLYAQWTATDYAISYAEVREGAVNPNPPSYTITNEVVFAPLDDAAVVGWKFAGWDPEKIDRGSTGAKTVTALWTRRTYTNVIDGASVSVTYGDEVTLAAPDVNVTNGWTNVVCVGWTGSGDVPAAGTGSEVSFTVSQASTLVWNYQTNFWFEAAAEGEENAVEIGEGGFDADPAGCWVPAGTNVVVEATGDVEMFRGWRDAETEEMLPDETNTVLNVAIDAPCGLVAVFEERTVTAVTFDANGGTGAAAPVTAIGGRQLPDISATAAPTRTGYRFAGYYDCATGGTKYYSADGTPALQRWEISDATIVLYAQWEANHYTVRFNANGGEGRMSDLTNVSFGVEIRLPSSSFSYDGMKFAGWALTPDGEVKYIDAAYVKSLTSEDGAEVVLYAVWSRAGIAFSQAKFEASRNDKFVLWVEGGADDHETSVKVNVTYGSATEKDLILKKAKILRDDGEETVEKKNLKFPLTLTWKAGDFAPKMIVIPTAVGKATDAPKYLAWNLSHAKGRVLDSDAAYCIGEIEAGAEYCGEHVYIMPYVTDIAGGKVSGGASVKPDAQGVYKSVTLKATQASGYWFTGWYDASGDLVSRSTTFKTTPMSSCGLDAYRAKFMKAPTWGIGTFNGALGVGDQKTGSAKVTISSAGKISGKLVSGGRTWTFASAVCDFVEESGEIVELDITATATCGALSAELDLIVASDAAVGNVAGDEIVGSMTLWRNDWADKGATDRLDGMTGLYTVQLASDDVGTGYLSLSLGKKGTCKATGKLPDGTAVSSSLPLIWDVEVCAPFALLQMNPSSYKGGYVGGTLTWGVRKGAAPVVTSNELAWVSLAPTATAIYGDGFDRRITASGAWYGKSATLSAYYQALRFRADLPYLDVAETWVEVDAFTGEKETVTQMYDVDASVPACWNELTISPKGNTFVVDQGAATKPVYDKDSGEWSYLRANDAALTFGFTKATGIFKGTFTCWYDYGSHASKKVSYEGIMVLGEPLRGFYLWSRTGTYEDEKTSKTKTFTYKESRSVEFN